MRRFLSTTLGQILIVTACSSAATFGVFVVMLFNPGAAPSPPWPWQTTYRIASVLHVLRDAPSEARTAFAARLSKPGFIYRVVPAAAACSGAGPTTDELAKALTYELHDGSAPTVRGCGKAGSRDDIQVLLPLDNVWFEARTSSEGIEPARFTVPFFAALAFLCVGVLVTSAWALGRIILPLRRLAAKADAFGNDMAPTVMVEEGALEIRQVAYAFNRLQERVVLALQSRTRTLAAISHDLRSPLTRMRLQLDTNAGESARDKLRKDVDLMQAMITSALAFLRTGSEQEPMEWLDLGALIATLCDEYEEGGAAIYYQGPDYLRLFCRPDAVRRALANLIDNALRYGQSVVVEASLRTSRIVIDVCDDGPGIPCEHLQGVLEPFVRLDPARAGVRGSVGLGLAIVRDIVHAHRGELTLENRHPSGLRARIVLPQS